MHLTVTAKDNSIPSVTTSFSATHIRDIDKSTLHRNHAPKQTGGATAIGVLDGGSVSMHHAKCDATDGFSRRLGILICLDRFVDQALRSKESTKRWYIVAYRSDHQGYSLIVDHEERTDWSNLSEGARFEARVAATRRQWMRITALTAAHKPGKWVEYTTQPKEDTEDVVYTSKTKRRFQRT